MCYVVDRGGQAKLENLGHHLNRQGIEDGAGKLVVELGPQVLHVAIGRVINNGTQDAEALKCLSQQLGPAGCAT